MSRLYAQVQFLEQRVLMLEQFVLDLTLHLATQKQGQPRAPMPSYQRPQAGQWYGRPNQGSYQTSPTAPANAQPWLVSYNEKHDTPQLTQEQMEVGGYDADFNSLAESMGNATDTEVAGIGGFGDVGAGDFGSDFGDGASDAVGGDDASDAGGDDAGGMD